MKNKILINSRARNHIKLFPLINGLDIPEDEGDKIRWCEERFKELEEDTKAVKLYNYSSIKKGFSVTVWESKGLYYMVQCIRNEFRTYNTTIYIHNQKQDCINIAKFLRKNVISIMNDYKQQILDAKKCMVEKNDPAEEGA